MPKSTLANATRATNTHATNTHINAKVVVVVVVVVPGGGAGAEALALWNGGDDASADVGDGDVALMLGNAS